MSTALDGVAPHRGLPGEHDRVGAVVDGGRDVGGFRSGRHRRGDHRLEHLGRHDHGLARAAARTHDPARDARDVLGRKLHPEIPARHHDRVGQLDDLVEPPDRGRLLELRQQSGAARERLTQREDIARVLHERRRHPVHAELQPQCEVLAVLVRQRRDGKHRVGDVDSLVIRDLAADPHPRAGEIRTAYLDFEPDLAVVDEEVCPRLQGVEDLGMGKRDPFRTSGRRIEIEGEGAAFFEDRASTLELPDPELRPLQVEQHPDGASGGGFDLADRLEAPAVVVVAAVAEVEPEHVDPGGEQRPDGLRRRRRGAEGGDDLREAVSSHRGSPGR